MLGLAVPVGIVEPVIEQPELLGLGIDVDAGYHANALDNRLGVAAPLAAHEFNPMGILFVQHSVVKEQVTPHRGLNLPAHVVPNQPRGHFLTTQITIDGIVAEGLAMVRKVRQRIVDLADQEILAIGKATYRFFHAENLPLFRHLGDSQNHFAYVLTHSRED